MPWQSDEEEKMKAFALDNDPRACTSAALRQRL